MVNSTSLNVRESSNAKTTHMVNKNNSLGRASQSLYFSLRVHGSRMNLWVSRLIIQVLPQRCDRHKWGTCPAKIHSRLTKLLHTKPPTLSDIGGASERTTVVGNNETGLLLAAHDSFRAHNCQRLSSLCPGLIEPNHKPKLHLLSAAGPLEFVAIDILGQCRRASSGNQPGYILTYPYSKLS